MPDVVGVAHEGLYSIKVRKMPTMVIKFDLFKAYNRVNQYSLDFVCH